ncbi:MAG TPA: VOC family protein [Acidisoma sp.]|uniref:VOC family protein n=1 Tax=Acidisoma sp. TaxID=1872115 RepID=UPI002CF60520|nr:VOC family protein [Acidisoma sp.]HTI00040.1 VOC family protein [Acidisoma sp.]
MSKMIHSMIRVLDEARSVKFYGDIFGLSVADRYQFEGFTLVYLRGEGVSFELELTVNHGRQEPYVLGDGYGHLAVAVEDLAEAHARMTESGATCTEPRDMAHDGQKLAAFFFVTDPDGYKIEVLQRFGRYS